jgi:dihydrofolate synthase/folylpolyglutamate synthase
MDALDVGKDMTYEQALAYISSLEPRGWRLGLDRMQEFVRRAGLEDSIGPEGGPQFIQVAGTNGKGSTTAFVQSLLVESGYRTGAYFSPYVVDPRERVQYGRDLIPKQDLAEMTASLVPAVDSFSEIDYGGITEFELKTAIGFQYWKRKRCEWVALEVGLGGRLDATTVVTPRACVIVSIGLDHMHILGDTRAKIAYEKAGIIKPGVPVIVGQMPKDAEDVILSVAADTGAPVWRWGREVVWVDEAGAVLTPNGRYPGLRPGIPGSAQKHNLALAVAALDAAGAIKNIDALQIGAINASIPGRFQEIEYKGRTVVLDGAHNPDAAAVLSSSLDARFGARKVVLVTNMLAGHEPSAFYEVLRDRIADVFVVPVDFHRATPVETMVAKLESLFDHVTGFQSPLSGLDAAVAAAKEDEIVLVTGTFYLVGELLRNLGA